MKSKVFVGSTAEGKVYAEAIVKKLKNFCEPLPWYEGVFTVGESTQSSLVESIRTSDFVVIVMTADDRSESRGEEYFSPRDNLIFEAGIGFGAIDPSRTFLVPERVDGLKIPSDLSGFTLTNYFDKTGNPSNDVKAAIEQIEKRVKEKGRKRIIITKSSKDDLSLSAISLIQSAGRSVILFGRDLSWANIYSDAIKERVLAGVDVQVFAENPKNDNAKDNAQLLVDVGAKVVFLRKDIGIKFTMIDHHSQDEARFMLVSKKRNAQGAGEEFVYNCEIHDAVQSTVIWNSLSRLYESLRDG